jgi:pimeloyl-ACP methyl ester carboxylesterase
MASFAPLILLPGLLCDAFLWRGQVADLADVAASFVPDLTLDESVGRMAARVLAAAPPAFSLAGLSMGGYVALEIMRQAPERVQRLALFSTGAAADDEARRRQRLRGIESLRLGRFVGVTSRMLPQLLHPDHVDGPLGAEVRAMAGRVGGEAFLRQQQAILDRPDSRPMLATIRVPTLVAVGEADLLTPPRQALELHRGIAGSTLHVLERCGHLPALEQPSEASRLLRAWLTA